MRGSKWDLSGLQLWNVATPDGDESSSDAAAYAPHLYTVVTQLKSASGNVNDASNTTFGVRHTAWDADTVNDKLRTVGAHAGCVCHFRSSLSELRVLA